MNRIYIHWCRQLIFIVAGTPSKNDPDRIVTSDIDCSLWKDMCHVNDNQCITWLYLRFWPQRCFCETTLIDGTFCLAYGVSDEHTPHVGHFAQNAWDKVLIHHPRIWSTISDSTKTSELFCSLQHCTDNGSIVSTTLCGDTMFVRIWERRDHTIYVMLQVEHDSEFSGDKLWYQAFHGRYQTFKKNASIQICPVEGAFLNWGEL